MEQQQCLRKNTSITRCEALSIKRKLDNTSSRDHVGRVRTTASGKENNINHDGSVVVKKRRKIVTKATPSSSPKSPPIYNYGTTVNGRFRIGKLLGTGSFGEVYRATDLINKKRLEYALKVEKQSQGAYGLLKIESVIYNYIKGGIGVPKISYFGQDKVSKNQILVMDLLGPSLQEMLTKCGGRFSPPTVAMLADQMLERVEYLHSRSLLHRDIKPENFLLGRTSSKDEGSPHYWKRASGEQLYLVDFGLAKKYRDEKLKHIKPGSYTSVTGTVRYASIHSHLGQELSRRDDLESIGYVLLYFLKGRLPWQGQDGKNRQEKHDKIQDLKVKIPIHDLCKGYPDLAKYIDYCRRLVYEEVPDYAFLRSIFRTQINQHKSKGFELVYDWNRRQVGQVS